MPVSGEASENTTFWLLTTKTTKYVPTRTKYSRFKFEDTANTQTSPGTKYFVCRKANGAYCCWQISSRTAVENLFQTRLAAWRIYLCAFISAALLLQVSREVRNACYSSVSLHAAPAPKLVILSEAAAALTGIPLETARAAKTRTEEDGGVQLKQVALALTGTDLEVFEGAHPFSSNYGGHQFGNWAGQLGDGRVCTLGEVQTVDPRSHIEGVEGIGHGSLVEVRLSPEMLYHVM